MSKINEDKKYSVDEIKTKCDKMGEEVFSITVTPQALAIISRYKGFPMDHFLGWWKKKFGAVNGAHLHQYFSVEDGIVQVNK